MQDSSQFHMKGSSSLQRRMRMCYPTSGFVRGTGHSCLCLHYVSSPRAVYFVSLYLCDKHPEGQCCRPLCLSMIARARQSFGNAWQLVRDICFVRHLEARSVVEWTRNVQTAVLADLDVNASCFMCPWTVGRRRAHNVSPFEM